MLRSQPFAWVPRGGYIGLPHGGTIVIRLGTGPSRQCLCSPASPPAVGARRLVGPVGCRPLGRQAGPTVGNRSIILKISYVHQDASMESTSNEGKGVHLHTLVERERKRSNERG